jgi:hypothetical protein
MNYLDTERTGYQNQDRYATSPEASGQETRFSSRLLVLVSWFFAQPDYQDATHEAVPIPMVPIAIGIGTSGNYLD